MGLHDQQFADSGRIKQSLVYWCYAPYWTPREMCQLACELGCQSIEVIDIEHWPLLKEFELTCALTGSHGFVQGLNNPRHHEACLAKLRERVDQAAAFGCPNVITFTGNRDGMSDDEGQEHCVRALKQIIGNAERQNVNLCLEMLKVINRVGSPRMKLLFDIYHVQIMDGDIITRLRKYIDLIGHIHTAGVPGRFELHGRQEINYRQIMEVLAELGYQGYVGHEFFSSQPNAEFARESLRKAVAICDV
jgi:hydroxypyruvate isomerase